MIIGLKHHWSLLLFYSDLKLGFRMYFKALWTNIALFELILLSVPIKVYNGCRRNITIVLHHVLLEFMIPNKIFVSQVFFWKCRN